MSIKSLHTYLRSTTAAKAIEYYKHVFGATERTRFTETDGRIGHAELEFGDTVLMLADEYPELGMRGPRSIGATTVSLSLEVDDAPAVIERAVAAGAEVLRPISDEFHGSRMGTIRDPFGHEWIVSQKIEELSDEEMKRRYETLKAKQDKP
jgi:PhnB protein